VPGALDMATVALKAFADHYLDRPCIGGWTDQFGEDGSVLSAYSPASTFYHVFCAIAEANRIFCESGREK
jgi:mannose/cellobiose epimerase-like protein (N-acyl-D-glucosamine 2-epimerase family)